MNENERPLIAVTMGDAAGIGPEVIARSWGDRAVHEAVRPFVVGQADVMRRAVELVGACFEVVEVERSELKDLKTSAAALPCLEVGEDVSDVPIGVVDGRTGEAAYQAVKLAAELALAGEVDAIVTAPLSKAALHAAGHIYPGHTELLAEMCGVDDFAMMLYLPPGEIVGSPTGLGVVHVTLHQALRSVFDDLSTEAVLAKCHLADRAMRELGARRPRVGVCALNPHAGEDGLFGDEEQTIIAPAVEQARAAGLDAAGPFPTDTLMIRARDGEFDAVVAMYHDQGHIALKLLGMHAAVNVTLGLPIVRTSVAHGTAFDRAWQGTARGEGMVAALLTAGKIRQARDA